MAKRQLSKEITSTAFPESIAEAQKLELEHFEPNGSTILFRLTCTDNCGFFFVELYKLNFSFPPFFLHPSVELP